MELTSYVESVKAGLRDGASLADEHTQQVAERLGNTLESSTRLALIQAITDAAAEISTEMAPGSVEVRMTGSEPTFVVNQSHAGDDDVTVLSPEPDDDSTPTESFVIDEDEAQARISLRLPQSVKEKVDQYADADGVSTNTWLLHRILEALADRQDGNIVNQLKRATMNAMRASGAVQFGNDFGREFGRGFPPGPPAPPAPPGFGPGWPGPGGPGPRGKDKRRNNSVQGWVQ